MNMQEHILTALKEQFEAWQELLDRLNEGQLTARESPSSWSVKDEIAHLMVWQQRSIARLEGALLDCIPEQPAWLPGVDPDAEGVTDQVNAWIYATYADQPWSKVYEDWRRGFLRLLALGAQVAQRDLLDSGRYSWMAGYSLADVLIASYDHHQEHYEKLQAKQMERKEKN